MGDTRAAYPIAGDAYARAFVMRRRRRHRVVVEDRSVAPV